MDGPVHFSQIFFKGPACKASPSSKPASVDPGKVTCPECRRYLALASVHSEGQELPNEKTAVHARRLALD